MILSGFPSSSKNLRMCIFYPKIWNFYLIWWKNLLACILENVICTLILPERSFLGIDSIY